MKNKILDLLRTEARLSDAEIGKRLGLTEKQVTEQIAALESSKTVLGYRAIVDPEKLDDEQCLAIIEVNITPQRHSGYDEIAAQVYKFPEVKMCYLVSGGYDVLVFVEGPDLKEVANFVSRKLATIEYVNSTATHFILRKYKDAGVVIGEPDQPDRLPVVP